MKKRTLPYIVGLAALAALASCNAGFENSIPQPSRHTVYFTAGENSPVTKTGITIDNTTVTPDWRQTKAANVHLYEYQSATEVTAGEDVEISISSDNLTATFKADFPEDMTIEIGPAGEYVAPTKAGGKSYTYSAVIAQQNAATGLFSVPAVQYPDPESLIDPDADFLIGYNSTAITEPHDYTEDVVDLFFDRPVAMGRLNLTNFFGTGESVKSVKISAQGGMSGTASLSDIDFAGAAVSFTPAEAGGIELSYGNGRAVTDDAFAAYFISLPGSVTITSIEVLTDQYLYTKTIAGGKEYTFSSQSFKSIKLDLSTAEREDAAPDNVAWYKASVLEGGFDYLIVSEGQALKNNSGAASSVAVSAQDGVITFDSSADPAIVWTATAHEEMTGDNGEGGVVAGHFTFTNDGQYLLRNSQDIELGSSIPSDKPKYGVWDYDGTYLKHESSATMTFYLYYDSKWTSAYTQNGAAPTSTIKAVQLYTTRPPVQLSFSTAQIELDIEDADTFVEPSLSGAAGEVAYSSSNEAVASVDASTGKVSIHKAGTAVITAVAAGNAEYQAGSASYTIVVTSSNVDTFYLASEIVDGESYMIVSGGYAMTLEGTTLGAVSVTDIDGTIMISAEEVALFEAAAHVEYYEGTSPAGHFTLSNGGAYLQRYSNSTTQTLELGAIPDTKKYYVWEYDGEHFYHISSSSNTFYVGYDSGWAFIYQSPFPNTYLYSTTKQLLPQRLSFSAASVSCVLGEPFTAPVLSGVETTVSYQSSDESVATVDSSTGEVTIVGLGETVITATAAANEEYNAGSASYTLKVTDGSTPTFYRATELVDGEQYLIVSSSRALTNDGGTIAATSVTASDDVIQLDSPGAMLWTATSKGSGFTLSNDGKYFQRASGSGSPSIGSAPGDNYYIWAYDEGNSYLHTVSGTTYYVYYSSGSSKWTQSSSASTSHTVTIYSATPPRQDQALSFSEASVTYDLADAGATFSAPALSGAQTEVTYSSSKPAVATVNAATGAVEIVGVGTTVITASAAGSDAYKPASASYTIHVIDSSAPVTTKRYVLATTIEDGKNYIIVSGGYALKNNAGSVASVQVEPAAGTLEFDLDTDVTDMVWTAAYDNSYPDNGSYTLQNDGKMIRRPSGGGTSLSIESSTSATSKYFVWLYDGEHLYHHNMGGQGGNTAYVYWLSYNGGWKFNYTATTDPNDSSATITQLYVEE